MKITECNTVFDSECRGSVQEIAGLRENGEYHSYRACAEHEEQLNDKFERDFLICTKRERRANDKWDKKAAQEIREASNSF